MTSSPSLAPATQILDAHSFGSSLSMRSFCRLGATRLGATMSVLNFASIWLVVYVCYDFLCMFMCHVHPKELEDDPK